MIFSFWGIPRFLLIAYDCCGPFKTFRIYNHFKSCCYTVVHSSNFFCARYVQILPTLLYFTFGALSWPILLLGLADSLNWYSAPKDHLPVYFEEGSMHLPCSQPSVLAGPTEFLLKMVQGAR